LKLKDKIVLVTGASSGIGKAVSELFAREGAVVILTGRRLDTLKTVEEAIKNNSGKAEAFSMDVTDRDQVKDTIKNIIDRYKEIDVLVNNAGIARWESIENVTYKDFDEHVKVNLIGYFNCIKEVVPFMVKEKHGSIVNVVTSTVKKTKANRVAYAASKYGQAGLSNAVHEDLKDKGISVVAVYPGKTDTSIHDSYIGKDDPKRKEMLNPVDVAKAVLEAVLIPVSVKELVM
jgi:3-oxoacyl-[acyl-carrier protein] reductase